MAILFLILIGVAELRIIGHSLINNIALVIILCGFGALAIYILVYLWTFWEEWHLETHGDKEA